MSRISIETTAVLQRAVVDTDVIARYRAHIVTGDDMYCHLWTGAIAGKGHGRFQIGTTYSGAADGSRKRRTHVVIAHRFGYALAHGLAELLATPIVAHSCDNPICQNPAHWRPSNHHLNGRDYANRRHTLGTPHVDFRGARGRAHAVRAAARNGASIEQAVLAGMPATHVDQRALFDLEGERL